MATGFLSPGLAPVGEIDRLSIPEVAPEETVGTVRVATAEYYTHPLDSPSSARWQARIRGDVAVSQEAMDMLGFGGRIGLTVSEIALHDADGWTAEMARYGTADGRPATVRAIPARRRAESNFGSVLAAAVTAFRGTVRAVERTGDFQARVLLGDIADRLDVSLQTATYSGSGGLEGGTELAGRPKPVTLGRVFNIAPVFLGSLVLDGAVGPLLTYQSHYRQIIGHDMVRIRGVPQVKVGGTPGVGEFRDFPATGMFQLGSSPDGEVTADVNGDAIPDYAASTAQVLRRLLQSLGPQIQDAEIDEDSWTLAAADIPGTIGWYQGPDDVLTASVVESILAGSGAVLAGARDGRLRLFDPLAATTDPPQFVIRDAWIRALQPVPLPAALRPLPRLVEVEWGRNWRPLSGVAGAVPEAERRRLESETPPIASASSVAVTTRVAHQRTLRLPGLYADDIGARARAEDLRDWIEAGPVAFELITDRYLGQVDLGAIGQVFYPAYGLDGGLTCTVMAWRETLSRGQLELTVVGTL